MSSTPDGSPVGPERTPAGRETHDPPTAVGGSDTRLRRGPFGVRRFERTVRFHFPPRAAEHLVRHGSVLKSGELIVRPHGDTVKLHRPSHGSYDSPPVLHGRVERTPDALIISGPVRETRTSRTWALAWGFVTGLMTSTAILGIVLAAGGRSGAQFPLLIGGISAPLFGFFWRGARRDRLPDFERQARELHEAVHRWFTSGDGRRGYSR